MVDPEPQHDGPSTKLLYVEGKDDYHVLGHLMAFHGIEGVCSVRQSNGVENLLDSLDSYVKVAPDGLGLVIDADVPDAQENALARRWESIRNRLLGLGYTSVPAAPDPSGTILPAPSDDMPTVGIWLMPDNTTNGQLEHLLQSLIPTGDWLWTKTQETVQGIPSEQRRFTEKQLPKAEIYTWLAWQRTPGYPFGLAIKEGYFDRTAPQAVALIAWLRRLFDPNTNN